MSHLLGPLVAAFIALVALFSSIAWLWKRSVEKAEIQRKERWQAFVAASNSPPEVAESACIAAGLRAAECELASQPLIRDPVAKQLCGKLGWKHGTLFTQLMIEQEGSGKSCQAAARARILDDELAFLLAAVAHEDPDAGAVQVVCLGCGMDTRPWRLRRGGSSRGAGGVKLLWFELDHPAVMELKQKLLQEAGLAVLPQDPQPAKPAKPKAAAGSGRQAAAAAAPAPAVDELHRVACDVTHDDTWCQALQAAGFDESVRSVWVVEGALWRLPLGRAASLLRQCGSMSPAGSRLLATAVSKECLEAVRGLGAPSGLEPQLQHDLQFQHCCDDLLAPGMLGSLGWAGALLPGDVSDICRARYKAECYPYFGRFSCPSAVARLTSVEHVLTATRT